MMETFLGSLQKNVDEAINQASDKNILNRIWDHDFTVWRSDPKEISNRLGWLNLPFTMEKELGQINDLVNDVQKEGYEFVLLLGMGGSSLAPEVFRKVFGVKEGYLDLAILDSTDPERILKITNKLDLSKTLFIVSTKSGGTVETLSFFKYFYNLMVNKVGSDNAGKHFVAITDPGSNLEAIASEFNFRKTFLNDPNLGGRYSALSFFGLVPAALVGVDLLTLLDRAQKASQKNARRSLPNKAVAFKLGFILSEAAKARRDKATFIVSPKIEAFVDWVEQLIAESTGKEGRGILPVVRESLGKPEAFSDDRLFIYLQLEGDDVPEGMENLKSSGQPIISIKLEDKYDLGKQFFIWELAIAIAGYGLMIHPFNQPNVESAKILARETTKAYIENGELPVSDSLKYTAQNLTDFLKQIKPHDYAAIQAFVTPDEKTTQAFQDMRLKVRDNYKIATTFGYGPRFLHSTGQLHKGDGGNGLFIQFVSSNKEDVEIPDEAGKVSSSMTFGILKKAQALGDAQALRNENRRVISFEINEEQIPELMDWMD